VTGPVPPGAGIASTAAARAAAVALGVACVAVAAAPLPGTGLAGTALACAAAAVAAGALRLALADVPQPEDDFLQPAYLRAWATLQTVLRVVPWEEIALVAVLWLEIQHPVRPWHTAVLGAGLMAYLLATHIAESGAQVRPLLRRQAGLLLAGACLLALAAGFAALPAVTGAAAAALLRILAAAAVIAAVALVLPGGLRHLQPLDGEGCPAPCDGGQDDPQVTGRRRQQRREDGGSPRQGLAGHRAAIG
jgi:hypothetical protein